jgi:hypothetical protein
MIIYGLQDVLRQRTGQGSFHIASEKALRVEFMRFKRGDRLGPLKIDGDVVVTCLEGAFTIGKDGAALDPLTQAVVPEGEIFELACRSDAGAIQIIWAPPFARSTPV